MKRFNVVSNGYDVDEVNRFIDIVIKRLEKLNAENKEYALEYKRVLIRLLMLLKRKVKRLLLRLKEMLVVLFTKLW